MNTLEKKITLILISHKSRNKIIKIFKNLKLFKNIIIVENSNDKSLKKIKKNKYIKIYFTKNNGYGAAINFANKYVRTKYFLVINPDIEKIDYNLIRRLTKEADKINTNFLCAGPRYLGVSSKTHKQSNVLKKIAKINAINGACMLFNKINFDNLKGFDEKFFLFFEENDICKRGNKNGFFSYQLNRVKIKHNPGNSVEYASDNEKKKYENLRTSSFIKSKMYFFQKYYGTAFMLLYFIFFLIRIITKNFFLKHLSNKEKYNKNKIRIISIINYFRKII